MSTTMTLSSTNGRKNGGWKTPTNGNRVLKSTPASNSNGSPNKKLLSKAEKLALREKARVAMTPPGQCEDDEEMEYQTKPQRTPLSMAIAMKAGTSVTPSSFPDSFWIPFLEQEEYERQQMGKLMQDQQEKRRRRQTNGELTERSLKQSFDFDKSTVVQKETGTKSLMLVNTTNAIQSGLTASAYLAVGLFMLSFLDVPYFRPFLEMLALSGRFWVGLCFWLYDAISSRFFTNDFASNDGFQNFVEAARELMEDIQDWIAVRM